jgi:CRISPR-associated protein Cas1
LVLSADCTLDASFHHKNELNAFNLVDDLIEPFRPFVDYEVYLLTKDYNNSGNKLSQQVRIELVSILNQMLE